MEDLLIYIIGNRAINMDAITHASFEPGAGSTGAQLVLSFGGDDTQIFYDTEAETVWTLIKLHSKKAFVIPPSRAA